MTVESKKKGMTFLKASAIQFTSRYANVALQLILTAVLARLLTPEQYGVMAGITIFTSLFSILADMGFGPAIIQFKQLKKDDYGSIFLFSIGIGLLLAAIFSVCAHPIASFFHDDSYISLCYLTTISIIFNSLNMVPNGLLLKDKKFFAIGIRLLISTAVGGAVAVILAMHGFGTASLIWQINITSIFVFLWNFIAIHKQISFKNIHIFHSVKVVISYSLYQAGFSIINYFSRNADHLIIGNFFGSAPLGFYDKAYKLTTYPISFVPGILGSVLQPFLSAYQNNKERLFYYQMLLVRFLALAGSWFMFVCLLCGGDIVNIMYGPQWSDCVPLFSILSASIAFQMVMNVTGGILQSAGRTDLLFRQGLLATAIMLSLVFVGAVTRNLTTLTICVTIAFFFQTFTVAYYTAVKAFAHKITEFLLPVFRIVIIAAAIALPELCAKFVFHWNASNEIINLIIYAGVYSLGFLAVFYFTGDLKRMVEAIRKKA